MCAFVCVAVQSGGQASVLSLWERGYWFSVVVLGPSKWRECAAVLLKSLELQPLFQNQELVFLPLQLNPQSPRKRLPLKYPYLNEGSSSRPSLESPKEDSPVERTRIDTTPSEPRWTLFKTLISSSGPFTSPKNNSSAWLWRLTLVISVFRRPRGWWVWG